MDEPMHRWKRFRAGGIRQAAFACGADVAALETLDPREWTALSMPVRGVRFDGRMLELMDLDGDGSIRTPEVLAAIRFLKERAFDFDLLFKRDAAAEEELARVLAQQADLATVAPDADERKALDDWERALAEVSFLGAATDSAEADLAAVEPLVEAYFTPSPDLPLVTEEPDRVLPLRDHLNPLHLERILAFAESCVKPVLGERAEITRLDWKRIKESFAPYRAVRSAKPVPAANARARLVEEERLLRYRLGLLEFLENFVNMRRLYDPATRAIFQTGVLQIDARAINLCLAVDDEGTHAALAAASKCCLVYARLTRCGETRAICAVVTAGRLDGLYVGRNGVFYDADGRDWNATVTKVVESQVSLVEAFWAPWKKLGEAIGGMVRKFLGERQAKVMSGMEAGRLPTPPSNAGNGAAMASSVAAIGIGVGMVGAAFASIMAAVTRMGWQELALSVLAVVAIVSLPSVILTWFKLRRRDLGAVLNASGWAVNRPLRFSQRLAARFTR